MWFCGCCLKSVYQTSWFRECWFLFLRESGVRICFGKNSKCRSIRTKLYCPRPFFLCHSIESRHRTTSKEMLFFQNLPWDLNIFTFFQKRVCEKQYTPCKMFHFPKIFFFSEQWLYSAGLRDSSLDPWSSQQRLRPPGWRDRSWHPVIPHERWTVDSPADHGHIYVRMSARSRQLLSDGFTWFSPEFSCPHATAPSNGKRQIEHERYDEKSPYQAPDRCHYSNAVRFDSHISRRGKRALINSSIWFFWTWLTLLWVRVTECL